MSATGRDIQLWQLIIPVTYHRVNWLNKHIGQWWLEHSTKYHRLLVSIPTARSSNPVKVNFALHPFGFEINSPGLVKLLGHGMRNIHYPIYAIRTTQPGSLYINHGQTGLWNFLNVTPNKKLFWMFLNSMTCLMPSCLRWPTSHEELLSPTLCSSYLNCWKQQLSSLKLHTTSYSWKQLITPLT